MGIPSTTLNNGVAMPVLGLGVYKSRPGRETRDAVRWALEDGYRHIDTARVYRNEADVGAAVRSSGLAREELFVVTKLWNADQGYDKTRRGLDQSLRDLGTDYVDLYLMHWPVTGKRLESWRAMETLLADGKCRAIGVSNFTVAHLEELLRRGRRRPGRQPGRALPLPLPARAARRLQPARDHRSRRTAP